MTELIKVNHSNPLEECGEVIDVSVEDEIKPLDDDEDASYNTMALLELATCIETHQGPMDFPTTEAVMYPKTGLMVCLLCLEDVEKNLLTDHMINAHAYRKVQLKCHGCGTKFADRGPLVAHKKTCRPPEKRPKRKSFQQIMKELDTRADSNEPLPCPICMVDMPQYCIKEHLLTVHASHIELMESDTLTCEICNRTFKNKLNLREHVKLVHELLEETEECEICGQKFRSQKYLSNHKRNVHPTDNKVHTCTTCGKTFKSRLCLHQHGKYVHPPPSAAVPCPHCPNKLFKTKISLHQHLKVSHGIYKRVEESTQT